MDRDPTSQFVHDLRNPINTISINAELGKLALQKNQDIEKTMKTLEEILSQCQQCGDIIEKFVTTHVNAG
jgi:signal transduction histidine kinase